MNRAETLMKILQEEYGITTMGELDKAISNQKKLDISVFVCDVRTWKGNHEQKKDKT